MRLLPLLRGELVVPAAEFDSPRLFLQRQGEQRTWSFENPSKPDKPGGSPAPRIGRLAVRDVLPGGAVYVLPDPNASGAVDLWVAWSESGAPSQDEVVRTQGSKECPSGLSAAATPEVRCLFLRVQL